MITGFKHVAILFLTLTSLAFYSGCSANRKSSVNSRHFIISLDDNLTEHDKTIEGTMRIRAFDISSPFQNTELVYRLGEVHYESDYYNRFIVSPSSIITEQSRKWIEQSALFENLAPSMSRALVHFSLEGEILSLYADLRDNDKPSAFMEIRFVVLNEIGAGNAIIFNKTYKASWPIETIEPSKIIVGYKHCLQQILREFLTDIEKVQFPEPLPF